MKKYALFLLPLLLLSLFSGCQQANPHKESDYILPQLSEERQAEIEAAWAKRKQAIAPDAPEHFYVPGSGQDGIRYYGSFTFEKSVTDIIFISCRHIAAPAVINIGKVNFSHRYSFVLLGYTDGHLFPLSDYHLSKTVSHETLLEASRIHSLYEQHIYGSVLTIDHNTQPLSEQEVRSAWLAFRGNSVSDIGIPCLFYGVHDGYGIVFEPTSFDKIETKTIGNETFTYGSMFHLFAYRNGSFYQLEDIFRDGLISQKAISEISEIHLQFHGIM